MTIRSERGMRHRRLTSQLCESTTIEALCRRLTLWREMNPRREILTLLMWTRWARLFAQWAVLLASDRWGEPTLPPNVIGRILRSDSKLIVMTRTQQVPQNGA